MKLKINEQEYTLITIVAETEHKKDRLMPYEVITAYAYVFDKDRKVHRFPMTEVKEVAK